MGRRKTQSERGVGARATTASHVRTRQTHNHTQANTQAQGKQRKANELGIETKQHSWQRKPNGPMTRSPGTQPSRHTQQAATGNANLQVAQLGLDAAVLGVHAVKVAVEPLALRRLVLVHLLRTHSVKHDTMRNRSYRRKQLRSSAAATEWTSRVQGAAHTKWGWQHADNPSTEGRPCSPFASKSKQGLLTVRSTMASCLSVMSLSYLPSCFSSSSARPRCRPTRPQNGRLRRKPKEKAGRRGRDRTHARRNTRTARHERTKTKQKVAGAAGIERGIRTHDRTDAQRARTCFLWLASSRRKLSAPSVSNCACPSARSFCSFACHRATNAALR